MTSGIIERASFEATKARVKTSGQLEPEYSLLKPYEEFPKKIEGSTVWKADDYRESPEKWTHVWSTGEVKEIETATNQFLDAGYELTDITKVRASEARALMFSKLGFATNQLIIIKLSGTFPSSETREFPRICPPRSPQWQRLHSF